jgi:hypothetical protein
MPLLVCTDGHAIPLCSFFMKSAWLTHLAGIPLNAFNGREIQLGVDVEAIIGCVRRKNLDRVV